jgi:hypothetical protein
MKVKNKLVCFICGEASEYGPGICSIGFHKYGRLHPNEKNTGYLGSFLNGASHLSCIEKYMESEEETSGKCAVCQKKISTLQKPLSSILTVYQYRKRGCKATMSMHDKCIKSIKSDKFFFIKVMF